MLYYFLYIFSSFDEHVKQLTLNYKCSRDDMICT